jgi:hypothetical protein
VIGNTEKSFGEFWNLRKFDWIYLSCTMYNDYCVSISNENRRQNNITMWCNTFVMNSVSNAYVPDIAFVYHFRPCANFSTTWPKLSIDLRAEIIPSAISDLHAGCTSTLHLIIYSELITTSNGLRSTDFHPECVEPTRMRVGIRPCLINRVIQRRAPTTNVLRQWTRGVRLLYIFRKPDENNISKTV